MGLWMSDVPSLLDKYFGQHFKFQVQYPEKRNKSDARFSSVCRKLNFDY